MMYDEFKNRMNGFGITAQQYHDVYEPLYMKSELDKDDFCDWLKKNYKNMTAMIEIAESLSKNVADAQCSVAPLEARVRHLENVIHDKNETIFARDHSLEKIAEENYNLERKVNCLRLERDNLVEDIQELKAIARKYEALRAMLKDIVSD